MRFKSKEGSEYQLFAVTGTNTVSFAIDASAANTKNLLGFAVERIDPFEKERYFVNGFKVFPSVIPYPDANLTVKTNDHPIQSFVWDDFTAKDGREYEYIFYPLKGTPKNLDRTAAPVSIKVRTESLMKEDEHDIFFNRGVASSQAYARRFGNKRPDCIKDKKEQTLALNWLARMLKDAIVAFIRNAKPGDEILGCFYEFRYAPVVDEFRLAINRGVHVHLIVDGKINEYWEKNSVRNKKPIFHESFPREENLRTMRMARIPRGSYTLRVASQSYIAHNKFMVLLRGPRKDPIEVWTGSTNISMGGIYGHTNVGHWVRNANLAKTYKEYWELLRCDPGSTGSVNSSSEKISNKKFRSLVEALCVIPTKISGIPKGITPIFSPRTGKAVLSMYAKMVSDASMLSCITLAFNIDKTFKALLSGHTSKDHITFLLLDKRYRPKSNSNDAFVKLNSSQNIYKAWGSYIQDPLYQWVEETNTLKLLMNKHVGYIHSKFLLMDPLGVDPIVVTGSANFSPASTNNNDENMLVIRGNQRVADIYLTEFNRLFFHYYFRSVQEATARREPSTSLRVEHNRFLDETDGWISKYSTGSFKSKRVALLMNMSNAIIL